ncbi:MAG: hypothetical protein IKI95_00415 [Clostridia bacterium]|nr:hypothetical protein [Clostridia bacterium]
MKVKIKRIWFYQDLIDDKKDKKGNDILLFVGRKWYDVIFQTDNDIIYIIAENNEKIGIDTNEHPSLFCLQKEYK